MDLNKVLTSRTKMDLIGDGMKIEGIWKFSASIMSMVLKEMRMNFPVDDNIAIISSDHHPASTIVSCDPKSVT